MLFLHTVISLFGYSYNYFFMFSLSNLHTQSPHIACSVACARVVHERHENVTAYESSLLHACMMRDHQLTAHSSQLTSHRIAHFGRLGQREYMTLAHMTLSNACMHECHASRSARSASSPTYMNTEAYPRSPMPQCTHPTIALYPQPAMP
jgi:hypothetical protein